MFRRSQVFFSNFLRNRVDRVVSNVPIKAIIEAEVNRQVVEALSKVSVVSTLRSSADEAVRDACDECDIEARLKDRIDCLELSDHIDYSQFAEEIDYSAFAADIETSSIADCIDLDDLASELDLSELASRFDFDDVASHLKDNLVIDVTVS